VESSKQYDTQISSHHRRYLEIKPADEGTYIVVNGNEVSVDMYSTSHCSSTACAAETYVNKTSWKAQAMVV
jgi:hypothetical protein